MSSDESIENCSMRLALEPVECLMRTRIIFPPIEAKMQTYITTVCCQPPAVASDHKGGSHSLSLSPAVGDGVRRALVRSTKMPSYLASSASLPVSIAKAGPSGP